MRVCDLLVDVRKLPKEESERRFESIVLSILNRTIKETRWFSTKDNRIADVFNIDIDDILFNIAGIDDEKVTFVRTQLNNEDDDLSSEMEEELEIYREKLPDSEVMSFLISAEDVDNEEVDDDFIYLRESQIIAVGEVMSAYENGERNATVVMPPGQGKTMVAVSVAIKLGAKSILFATYCQCRRDDEHDWEKFGLKVVSICHASLKNYVFVPFDLVIFDECHHFEKITNKCRKIYDSMTSYTHGLLLTATPEPDATLYQKAPIVFKISVLDCLNRGWMPKLKALMVDTSQDDEFSDVDGNPTFVAMQTACRVHPEISNPLIFWRFCCDSEIFCTKYQDDIETHECEHTDYRDPEKALKISRFTKVPTSSISSVNVIGEGYDNPSCQAVFFAVPRKSERHIEQKIGRCLRPKEGKHTSYIIFAVKRDCDEIIDVMGGDTEIKNVFLRYIGFDFNLRENSMSEQYIKGIISHIEILTRDGKVRPMNDDEIDLFFKKIYH